MGPKPINYNTNSYSERLCKIIPTEKEKLETKNKKLREIIDFYNDMRTKSVLLSAEKDFYNDIVSKGELFKNEIKNNVPEDDYKEFVQYLDEIKNMKYLF